MIESHLTLSFRDRLITRQVFSEH